MPEELRPYLLQVAVIVAAALGLWFFWKLARAVVRWGYFVMYFVMGSLICLTLQPSPTTGVTLAGGLAFAWTVMAIKAKLWKLFGAVAVIAAMPFFTPVAKAIGNWARAAPERGTNDGRRTPPVPKSDASAPH